MLASAADAGSDAALGYIEQLRAFDADFVGLDDIDALVDPKGRHRGDVARELARREPAEPFGYVGTWPVRGAADLIAEIEIPGCGSGGSNCHHLIAQFLAKLPSQQVFGFRSPAMKACRARVVPDGAELERPARGRRVVRGLRFAGRVEHRRRFDRGQQPEGADARATASWSRLQSSRSLRSRRALR